MKNGNTGKGGRRPEMNVALGVRTIERYNKLYAEGDFSAILRIANAALTAQKDPPTTLVTVSKHIKGAAADPNWKMPLSIAKAAQQYYAAKEKETRAVAS